METPLRICYIFISSKVHMLAALLDTATFKSRYSELVPFLNGRQVLAVAQAVLESDLQYVGEIAEKIKEALRLLAMHVSGQRVFMS